MQNIHALLFILWSNGDLSPNPILQGYLRHLPHAFELRVENIGNLAAGTALEGSRLLNVNDGKVWIDGDLVRCGSMAVCGWTWTRCSQGIWNPYWSTSSSRSGTATVSTLHRSMLDVFQVQQINLISLSMVHSCISINVRRTSVKSSIYGDFYAPMERLDELGRPALPQVVATSCREYRRSKFTICFSDGRACRLDNRILDPFEPDRPVGSWWGIRTKASEMGGMEGVSGTVFSIHPHNQWDKEPSFGGCVVIIVEQV